MLGTAGDSHFQTLIPLPFLSFWFFKFLLLVGLTVGAFYIPDGSFTAGEGLWVGRGVPMGFVPSTSSHLVLP